MTSKEIKLPHQDLLCDNNNALQLDDLTNNSIIEFLNYERNCDDTDDCGSELDIEIIFDEISRLSACSNGAEGGNGNNNNAKERNVEEILREAEELMQLQTDFDFSRKKIKKVLKIKDTTEKDVQSLKLPSKTNKKPQPTKSKLEINNLSHNNSSKNNDNNNNDNFNNNEFSIDKNKKIAKNAYEEKGKCKKNSKIIKNSNPNNENQLIKTFDETFSINNKNIENNITTTNNQNDEILTKKQDNLILASPINSFLSLTSSASSTSSGIALRKHNLEHEINQLEERLKDTEERLEGLKIQHNSLTDVHRVLRDNYTRIQDESEKLKYDVVRLSETTNILRNELQSAQFDRNEALEIKKQLQEELDMNRFDKKKFQEQIDKDGKTILDLQRQCREMERILLRKHPDSVSALIVASKTLKNSNDDNTSTRRLLEQRIAQLETDAKEQDMKAQKILANVQARFSSVQAKYETHIADLETQVLSLQEINAKLNEKINSQKLILLENLRPQSILHTIATQTDTVGKDTQPIGTQTDFKIMNNNGNQSETKLSKTKSYENNINNGATNNNCNGNSSNNSNNNKHRENPNLLATIRGMRIDLAIKEKAMQRLTKDLDECKKLIKKLQREKEGKVNGLTSVQSAYLHINNNVNNNKKYDPTHYSNETVLLKEAQHKIKLLECDYKSLHEKRLQDLKTLQAAHDRELSSCHETVRILQQRLNEREEAIRLFETRRKVPIDYYSLKAKVTSLERRHCEREQRLHILIDALSKGRFNDNFNNYDDILKNLDGKLHNNSNNNNHHQQQQQQQQNQQQYSSRTINGDK